MKKQTALLALTTSIFASYSVAGTMGPVVAKDWTWVSSVSVGPAWARAGDTQTFFLAPEIEKTYVARKSTKALAVAELFFGAQKSLSDQWSGQLGIELATTSRVRLQGNIWDDADPSFDNYTYSYKVKHNRIVAKGKLLLDKGYFVIPWVSASVGAGFNRSYAFQNTPTIFEAVPNADFANHTKTTFAYTLGAGVQKSLNEHFQVGVGYEFADWGRSELGRAAGQTLNTGLQLDHLYTHGVLFNLTWLA
ncbi:outer membrane protein [Legionella sp. 16cNR16C]|uniref:outer membrane protein n=1 Tax=Legionella sp. 16cNR16C TaxID=2905656 RepID=UPI001E3ED6BA|nr:porin family protein [Legionella sp. 16cNR16C]MCE3044847.1 porin family protein [Legionella sp. 16cNR16C]